MEVLGVKAPQLTHDYCGLLPFIFIKCLILVRVVVDVEYPWKTRDVTHTNQTFTHSFTPEAIQSLCFAWGVQGTWRKPVGNQENMKFHNSVVNSGSNWFMFKVIISCSKNSQCHNFPFFPYIKLTFDTDFNLQDLEASSLKKVPYGISEVGKNLNLTWINVVYESWAGDLK